MQEYIQECERLTVLCDVNEAEEMRLCNFIAGLREEIRRKLIFTLNLTIHSAGNVAIEVQKECQQEES